MQKYFKIQKEFQKLQYSLNRLDIKEKTEMTKGFILSAHRELSELLDCFNWKKHRKEDKNIKLSNVYEEIIDVFKFLINISLLWELDAKKFDKAFESKTAVVLQRYKQEFLTQKSKKVCAIDLDEVLCNWENHYVDFYNKMQSTNYASYNKIKENENTLIQEKIKSKYRESGEKRNISPMFWAKELTNYLKRKGYQIVIISARPYREYNRIFSDTIYWLKKNKIKYDDIYFDDKKHLTILKKFPKLKFIIEDNIEYAKQVAKEEYRVFWLNRFCDSDSRQEQIVCINSLKEIKKYV